MSLKILHSLIILLFIDFAIGAAQKTRAAGVLAEEVRRRLLNTDPAELMDL
ncbi:hypothetical protein KY290_036308 [Solanum tuberosum]|uniref:Uncharacterized protein n=1 Tax=Solanum tuberosum TaxID=4113 RepID=A0ABQ7TTU9_SOLTU|nr:hypothetical protein KY285_035590 [Solanum tuberosum]KAH0737603.1 hypothetical protein KY290_036308 [Solanum tuberosum]